MPFGNFKGYKYEKGGKIIYKRAEGRKLNERQKKEVKSIIKKAVEYKHFTANIPGYGSSTTGEVTGISAVPQGDTDTDRDGDRLKLASTLYFRYEIRLQSGSLGDNTNIVRVMVFQWRPNTTPQVADILNNGPASGGAGPDYLSALQHDTRMNYKILYDRTHFLAGNGYIDTVTNLINAPYGCCSKVVRSPTISLKNVNHQIQFQSGGLVGNNKLYTLTISDSSVVPHPTVVIGIKFLYTDS